MCKKQILFFNKWGYCTELKKGLCRKTRSRTPGIFVMRTTRGTDKGRRASGTFGYQRNETPMERGWPDLWVIKIIDHFVSFTLIHNLSCLRNDDNRGTSRKSSDRTKWPALRRCRSGELPTKNLNASSQIRHDDINRFNRRTDYSDKNILLK